MQLLPALIGPFDVAVAAHGPGPVREAAQRLGVRFHALRHVRRPIGWRDALGLLELIRLLRRERPAIVHANSSKAGILARLAAVLAGVPIRIFTVHGWAFAAEPGRAALVYRWADRLIARFTTATICVSERDRVAGVAAGTCRAERTVVIRNAVDASRFRIAAAREEARRIVSVGRLKAPKDFLTLLRALAAATTPLECLIVGDGPDRPRLEAEIARLALAGRVTLTGERSDVRPLLASSDLFVLSSRSEGLPISILEAMAAGLPVVASAVGGVPELVIDGETGFLVPAGDVGALAATLDRLVADGALRARLGAAGRARAVEEFDLASFRSAHVALYSRALGEYGLRVPDPYRAER